MTGASDRRRSNGGARIRRSGAQKFLLDDDIGDHGAQLRQLVLELSHSSRSFSRTDSYGQGEQHTGQTKYNIMRAEPDD